MSMVKIADLKNNLSRHLAYVRKGGEITVLDRDTPVARIVPFLAGERAPARRGAVAAGRDSDRIAELARQGVVAPGDPAALAAWFEAHAPVRLPEGSRGAVDVLLEMRRESTR